MKNNGVIKSVDKLGRVVIPKQFRNRLGIQDKNDCFEIFSVDDKIILKKYQPTCIFCDTLANSILFEGHCVCENCIEKMKGLLDESRMK